MIFQIIVPDAIEFSRRSLTPLLARMTVYDLLKQELKILLTPNAETWYLQAGIRCSQVQNT